MINLMAVMATNELVQRGFTVLLHDVDVVWLRDPLPALAKLARHRDLVGMISAHYKARREKDIAMRSLAFAQSPVPLPSSQHLRSRILLLQSRGGVHAHTGDARDQHRLRVLPPDVPHQNFPADARARVRAQDALGPGAVQHAAAALALRAAALAHAPEPVVPGGRAPLLGPVSKTTTNDARPTEPSSSSCDRSFFLLHTRVPYFIFFPREQATRTTAGATSRS